VQRIGNEKLPGLLIAVMGACLLGTASIPWTAFIAQHFGDFGSALLVFLLPTLFMGALFSHLIQQAKDRGLGLGRSLALNTLGASLAPALFGFVILPWVGVRPALLICGLAYFILLPTFRWLRMALYISLFPLLVFFLWDWSPLELEAGQKILR
jgi:spermidine synthase